MDKKCNMCGEVKSLDDFHRDKNSKDGRQRKCKPCNNSSVRAWMDKNPDKFEANWRKHSYGDEAMLKRRAARYGLTAEQLASMIEESGGKCKVCGRTPSKGLVVDHCHNSNIVRGLICHNCNTSLGLMLDNSEWLRNLAKYIDMGQ